MAVWLLFHFFLPLLLLLKILNLIQSKLQKKKLPPGPRGLPIIGNLHQLVGLPHRSVWKLSQKYGPVMYMRLGTVPMVVVSSPETARQVLKDHDTDCCSRPRLAGARKLSYNYHDIAFAPYGDYLKEIRKICALDLFSYKRVRSFQSVREEEIAWLINSISQSASSGTSVNLSEKILSLTASVICKVAFGVNFQGSTIDNDKFQELIHNVFKTVEGFSASDFFPYVGTVIDWLTGQHALEERSFRDLDRFHERTINVHLEKSGEGNEDIIDLLLKLEREQVELGNGHLITRNHIKGILNNMLLGGTDTAGITLIWGMTELARKPKVLRKVQAEIRHRIGKKGKVSLDDTTQLNYLKMVVKETLRLHPPVPLLAPREVMSEFQINGYTIYPKTRLQVNVWAIGRDPDIWKDPEEFLPERFAHQTIEVKGKNFELLPFGGGRRICPAIYMGMVTVELALANLLYHFDWKLPYGMTEKDIDMEEAAGVTVSKKLPLQLVPVKYHAA